MRSKLVFALALFAALATPITGNALAAPDQTLGMAIMSAFVFEAGNLKSGAGAVSSAYDGNGNYTVKFNRPLAGCVGTASSSFGGVIASSFVDPSGDTVEVEIYSHAGTRGEASFQVIVFCPK